MRPRPKSKSSKSKSKSKCVSLTLFQQNVVCDEKAVPLRFVDLQSPFLVEPVMQEPRRTFRRSPRLETATATSPSKKAKASSENADKCVRRSLRLASHDVEAPNSTLLKHKEYNGGKLESNGDEEKGTVADVEMVARLMDQSGLRNYYRKVSSKEASPRNLEFSERRRVSRSFKTAEAEISYSGINLKHLSDSKEKSHSKKLLIDKLDEKHIRRSPRFSIGVVAANCNSKSSKSILIDKLEHIRRSPRFNPTVAAANSNSNSNHYSFIDLSDSKPKCHSKNIMFSLGTSDSKSFVQNCSKKSPIKATSMSEAGRREAQCVLIQFPDAETEQIEGEINILPETYVNQPPNKVKAFSSSIKRKKKCEASSFIGDPFSDVEARERWGWRYQLKICRVKDLKVKA